MPTPYEGTYARYQRAEEFYWKHVNKVDYVPKSDREMIAMLVDFEMELKHRLAVYLAARERFKSVEAAEELLDQL
jgi:hypothetical protein